MAADETKATKVPPASSDAPQATPASRAPSPSAKKNSVVAPTYAYKIIATLGHLCVTAFVLASFAGWYYLLNNRAKIATFCLFVYAHYRYIRMQHVNWLEKFADRKARFDPKCPSHQRVPESHCRLPPRHQRDA